MIAVSFIQPYQDCMSFDSIESISGGDTSFLKDILGTFLESTPQLIGHLERSCLKGDQEKVRLLVHQLKPTFSILDLDSPKMKLEKISLYLRTQMKEKVFSLLEELKEDLSFTYHQVRVYLLTLENK